MNAITNAFAIAAAAFTLLIVIEMLRRKRVRERHAIWWLVAATLALIVSVFPATLDWAAGLLGIETPINLAFFVTIVILSLTIVQHSAELTTLEEKTRTLAERVALVENRLDSSTTVAVDESDPTRPSE